VRPNSKAHQQQAILRAYNLVLKTIVKIVEEIAKSRLKMYLISR